MPYHTRKVKGGFMNINKKTGDKTSKKPMTKSNAEKQKKAIAISDKKKEKPVMKPKKDLSARQKQLMKEHKIHHSKEHMAMMRKLMKQGFCFEQAHEMTMKKIGK